MRGSTTTLLALTLLAVSACGTDSDGQNGPSPFGYDSGTSPIVTGDAGGFTPATADAAVTSPPTSTDAAVINNPPFTAADAGAVVDAGALPVEAGTTNDAGPPVSVGGKEPTIPPASMACPSFKSGNMNIMGLSVEVTAGPQATGGAAPLLFYWHGTGGTGAEAQRTLPASVRNDIMSQGGIIIAPSTTTMKGDDVTFVLGVWYTPGDFEFADLVAACAVKDYNIDPRRIYATGCSAGGLATGVMAFQRSNYLAASAPNSGGIAVPGQDQAQDPMRVAPTMTMHGAAGSDVVIVDFSETSNTFYTSAKAKGAFVVDCDHGGGHCAAPQDLQAAAWQFMKDHPYGVSPEPYANGLPASFPSYCQIK